MVTADPPDARVKVYDPSWDRFTIWEPHLTLAKLQAQYGGDVVHDSLVEVDEKNAQENVIEHSPLQSVTPGNEPIYDTQEVG